MSSHDQNSWERIEPILEYALDLPQQERAHYLDRACGHDISLRRKIEEMIDAGEDPNGFLERSISDVAGPLMLELDGPLPAQISPGAMFGPWRVVRELGHGGMGEVFLAERADGQFAQTAALKLVRRGREHDPLLIRRFLEERRILASLAHPNVARLLDGGVTPAMLPWFAMEYVDGRPLDVYCDEHQLDIAARLALMEQVLGAVAYAHRNLLVHRDLKPSNIFVTSSGEVKLLDFGIAKLLGEENISDPALTIGYNKVMTPEYAAPEQVRGEPVTTATDIYSLGAVLYELLTGQRAHRFDKRSAAEIERVICDTEPESPSQAVRTKSGKMRTGETNVRRPRLAADLDTIVLKALQKDPLRRYASAEAMLDDLRRYRSGRPLLARPDSARYRWGKFISRNRYAVAATAVIALLLASAVAATVWQARAAQLEAARANSVKEFLVDLLHQADPNITQGREFSVRELLDRGTHRVESMLTSEPAVQAELYEVLGNTYSHLGRNAQADTLHRKGLAVARQLYGSGSEEVLDEAMAVGWGLNDRGNYADADTLLTASIAEYRNAGGKDGQALSDALDVLATAKKRSDQPVEAESLYRQSLRLQLRLTGPSDTITASRLGDLASLFGGQDRLIEADSMLSAAQEHRRGVLPPLDTKFLVGESSLAGLKMKRGDFAGAEPRLRTALDGLEKIEAPGGLNLARTIERWALLQSLELHAAKALESERRSSAMFTATMGPDHPETLNSISVFAGYREATGDAKGAEASAREAYEALRKKMGDRHDYTLGAGQRLAMMELDNGERAEAAALATALLASVRDKYHRVTPAYARLLAANAAAQPPGADSSAERDFRASLAALDGGTRLDSAALPSIVAGFAEVLAARGKGAEAQAMLMRTLAWLPKSADSSAAIVETLRRELHGRQIAIGNSDISRSH